MEHMTCDICGKGLLLESDVRYEVRIEVKAAYDPMEITKEDLEKDYGEEIRKLIAQLENISEKEAQDEVYRVFNFDLCWACQKRYIKDPLRLGT
jgi:hypothetical protein